MFSLRAGLPKKNALMNFKMVHFLLPLLGAGGFLPSGIPWCENPEVEVTRVVPCSCWLRLIHTGAPETPESQFRFSCPRAGSHWGFCSGKLWLSVLVWRFLQFWGQRFALWPHLSEESKKKNVDFQVFKMFFLLIGQSNDYRVPSVLGQKPNIRLGCFSLSIILWSFILGVIYVNSSLFFISE